MLLHTAPQDAAILSNVGEVGNFKIKASAKAFSILSSGLYANKIRAIIRELSCNAVDSHVAAGRTDTPFDVHLPNDLEPWFSIRDYGTGLSHEQVSSIYTTYFESTKTESNDYIGALGWVQRVRLPIQITLPLPLSKMARKVSTVLLLTVKVCLVLHK